MKKFGIIAIIVLLLLIGLFIWALSGASPDHAPTAVRTIDVTPSS